MGDTSTIEWTDATWNPVTGCTKVSPGCDHCYAEGIANRFRGPAFPNGFEVTLREKRLREPLRWREPRRVFVNSMSDLFHDSIRDDYIARVFAVMALTPRHTYQLLTKRHGRMRSLLNDPDFHRSVAIEATAVGLDIGGGLLKFGIDHGEVASGVWYPAWPLPNVWVGVSVEDQKWADIRVRALVGTPGAVRFLSIEPLLGPITFRWRFLNPRPESTNHLEALRGIDWMIVGGESGAGSRPMHPEWVRTLRDEATQANVAFFFKQWGSHDEHGKRMSKHAAGRLLDGRTWDEYPSTVPVSLADGSTPARPTYKWPSTTGSTNDR